MSKGKSQKLKTIQNGKGSKPRNISEKFRQNYEEIRWDGTKRKDCKSI